MPVVTNNTISILTENVENKMGISIVQKTAFKFLKNGKRIKI